MSLNNVDELIQILEHVGKSREDDVMTLFNLVEPPRSEGQLECAVGNLLLDSVQRDPSPGLSLLNQRLTQLLTTPNCGELPSRFRLLIMFVHSLAAAPGAESRMASDAVREFARCSWLRDHVSKVTDVSEWKEMELSFRSFALSMVMLRYRLSDALRLGAFTVELLCAFSRNGRFAVDWYGSFLPMDSFLYRLSGPRPELLLKEVPDEDLATTATFLRCMTLLAALRRVQWRDGYPYINELLFKKRVPLLPVLYSCEDPSAQLYYILLALLQTAKSKPRTWLSIGNAETRWCWRVLRHKIAVEKVILRHYFRVSRDPIISSVPYEVILLISEWLYGDGHAFPRWFFRDFKW